VIFQHTVDKVLDGTKTQTRRPVKPGQTLEVDENYYPDGVYEWQPYGGARTVYYVGNTYAVQPGRGKPAIWWKHNNDELLTRPGVEYRPTQDCDGTDYETLTRVDCRDYLHEHGWMPARIRITGLRREDVRTISDDDVKAEGFGSRDEFMQTWEMMHKTYDAWVIEFELLKESVSNG
jgi:hypothetical protein